jgi:DNA polymerase-3 subunit epsilon
MAKPLMNPLETEVAIANLHSSGNFKVLRRLNLDEDPRFTRRGNRRRIPGSQIALCLDTETTGLNCPPDKIIELGIVAFEYVPGTGEISKITGRYSGFADPGAPLPEVITQVTGITDAMVAGQVFDDGAVLALAEQASLVIAHNAGFDRPFVESRFPCFAALPWACTLQQIDWAKELINSRNLDYLLYRTGYFIDAHRALHDAEGVLGLLLERLPVTGVPAFPTLLDRAGETTCRILAIGSPFDAKDLLKASGYRWSDGSNGKPKAWWTEIPEDDVNAELAYLAAEIYPRGDTSLVEITRIDALTRFSRRVR